MKNKLIYDHENMKIIQVGYNNQDCAKTESIFAQGNGYLGIRAVDLELSSSNKEDLFVNGIFNKSDDSSVPELANLANSMQMQIKIDGRVFYTHGEDEYEKFLSLNDGVVKRVVTFIRNDKKFQLINESFVSNKRKNIYAQKIILKQLSGEPSKIIVFPNIDGQTTNSGNQHLKEGTKKLLDDKTIQYEEETNWSNVKIKHNMVVRAYKDYNEKTFEPYSFYSNGVNDDMIITMARRRVGFKISSEISTNKPFIIEKLMSVNTTADFEVEMNESDLNKKTNESYEILANSSYNSLFKENINDFNQIYKDFNVKIIPKTEKGKFHELALKFALYHVNNFSPKDNSFLNVGAKGLSGEGYQGHTFWDTEFFVFPIFLFINPAIAKNLLLYRYHGIEGARDKAKEKALKGAQYPWEMAQPAYGEVCPYWGQPDIKTGIQVPIASREQEIHVPGDIAFAVDQYYKVTKDEEFMIKYGYEIILDTAVFWTSRVTRSDVSSIYGRNMYNQNNLLGSNSNYQYEIHNVMGPNEYKGNINNNAFTNQIAKRNLKLALKYIKKLNSTQKGIDILRGVLNKIPYKVDKEIIKEIEEKIKIQVPNGNGIIAENDSFLNLPIFDLKDFQLLGDAGKKLFNTMEGNKRLSGQIVKQADVVLTTYVFKELFSDEIIKKNFHYYLDKTTHDSSLSAVTYALQGIELRELEIANDLFEYALNIDLGPNFHSSDAGYHAGSLAAVWHLFVFGYGGFHYYDGMAHFNPVLNKEWSELDYSIKIENSWINVVLKKDFFEIKITGEDITVFVNNRKTILSEKFNDKSEQKFIVEL